MPLDVGLVGAGNVASAHLPAYRDRDEVATVFAIHGSLADDGRPVRIDAMIRRARRELT